MSRGPGPYGLTGEAQAFIAGARRLPRTLDEAIDHFRACDVQAEAMGARCSGP
jgi:glutamine synthetase